MFCSLFHKTLPLSILLAALSQSSCDRSAVRSEWLLQKYILQLEEKNSKNNPSILLFLRDRYSDWPAGKLAALLLEEKSQIALSRLNSGCREISWNPAVQTTLQKFGENQESPEAKSQVPMKIIDFQLSRDKKYAAFMDSSAILHLELAGKGKTYALLGPLVRETGSFAISPDTRLLALRADSLDIILFNIWSGRWYRKWAAPRPEGARLHFTYGSLLLETGKKEVAVYDAEYGREIIRFGIPSEIEAVSWGLSADGNELIYGSKNQSFTCNLQDFIGFYLEYRAYFPPYESLPASVGPKAAVTLSLDSTLILLQDGMSELEEDSGHPEKDWSASILIDQNPAGKDIFFKFKDSGGYTIPAWWPREGLAYTLALADFRDLFPRALSLSAEEKSSPPAILNWFEARALAEYCGKSLPSVKQWIKAYNKGLIEKPGEEIWEWCRPDKEQAGKGYETVGEIFSFPLKSAYLPEGGSALQAKNETWLVPGYFREKTCVRFVIP